MSQLHERPQLDAEIDAILMTRLSPIDHFSWWHAEHEAFGWQTPAEVLAAGNRSAVVAEARLVRPRRSA